MTEYVGWTEAENGEEQTTVACYSLVAMHGYPHEASFKLLATFFLMQLSRQLALFALTVHCWHVFNLIHILTPKSFWGRLLLSQLLSR